MSSEDHVRSKQTSNSPVTCHTQAFYCPLLPAVLLRCENNNFPLLITECEFLALPSDLHVLTWISMVPITKLDLVFKSGTLLHFSWRIVVVY